MLDQITHWIRDKNTNAAPPVEHVDMASSCTHLCFSMNTKHVPMTALTMLTPSPENNTSSALHLEPTLLVSVNVPASSPTPLPSVHPSRTTQRGVRDVTSEVL